MKKVYQFDQRLSHRQSLKLSSGFEIVIKRRQGESLELSSERSLAFCVQRSRRTRCFVGSHQSLQAWNFYPLMANP
jgi:hypothetical protein